MWLNWCLCCVSLLTYSQHNGLQQEKSIAFTFNDADSSSLRHILLLLFPSTTNGQREHQAYAHIYLEETLTSTVRRTASARSQGHYVPTKPLKEVDAVRCIEQTDLVDIVPLGRSGVLHGERRELR